MFSLEFFIYILKIYWCIIFLIDFIFLLFYQGIFHSIQFHYLVDHMSGFYGSMIKKELSLKKN